MAGGRPGDGIAIGILHQAAAGERPIRAGRIGDLVAEIVDRDVAVGVRVEEDRHIGMPGRRIDHLQVAVGIRQLHGLGPGHEDRQRRGPQRRQIRDIEIGQVGVDGIDQGRIERHRHLQVGEGAVALPEAGNGAAAAALTVVSPRYWEWNVSTLKLTSAIAPVVPSLRVKLPVAVMVLPAWVSPVCVVEAKLIEAMPACARVSSSPASTAPFWLPSTQMRSCE